jgi:hypothetical protein
MKFETYDFQLDLLWEMCNIHETLECEVYKVSIRNCSQRQLLSKLFSCVHNIRRLHGYKHLSQTVRSHSRIPSGKLMKGGISYYTKIHKILCTFSTRNFGEGNGLSEDQHILKKLCVYLQVPHDTKWHQANLCQQKLSTHEIFTIWSARKCRLHVYWTSKLYGIGSLSTDRCKQDLHRPYNIGKNSKSKTYW